MGTRAHRRWLLVLILAVWCSNAWATPTPKPTRTPTLSPTPTRTPIATPVLSKSYIGVDINGGQDFKTIQAAIDFAGDGSKIKVWPGVYKENIDFKGKRIELYSTSIGSASVVAATVIDGQQKGPVVKMIDIPSSGGLLAGFTIQNGQNDFGGGIQCINSSPVIKRCVIQSNVSIGKGIPSDNDNYPHGVSRACGAGIFCRNGSPTIQDCSIRDNSAVFSQPVSAGGGIYCDNSSPRVIRCSFDRNHARGIDVDYSFDHLFYAISPAAGGGAYCTGGSPVFEHCAFMSNTVQGGSAYDHTYGEGGIVNETDGENGFGGGLCLISAKAAISDCTIAASSVRGGSSLPHGGSETYARGGRTYGGGIYTENSELGVARCMIKRNSAAAEMTKTMEDDFLETNFGVGIYLRNSKGTVNESVISWGVASNGSPITGGGISSDAGSSVSIQNCTIAYNGASGLHGPFNKIANCILWGNKGSTNGIEPLNCCIQYWTGGGPGNISADPRMVSPWGDNYHLLPDSPCIDAGRLTYARARDFEGMPRGYDGANKPTWDGSNYDIGADEWAPLQILNLSRDGYIVGFYASGQPIYADKDYVFQQTLETWAPLKNILCINTLSADNRSTGSAFLTFDVTGPAVVSVAIDGTLPQPPAWLAGWTREPIGIKATDTPTLRNVYSRAFPKGKITLGGNVNNAAQNARMYSVAVTPAPPEITETGDKWTSVTLTAPWGRRTGHSTLVFDNKMWLMGGTTTSYQNDVWQTSDGYWWKMATPRAAWSPRSGAASLVFNNRMWIMGGESDLPRWATTGFKNDVFSSNDGINWTTATAKATWEPRAGAAAVSFKGKMWILGGYKLVPSLIVIIWPPLPGRTSPKYLSDVYSSPDGAAWTTVTLSAPWPARAYHGAVVFNNEIWLMGGRSTGDLQDVWHSPDGLNWIKAPQPAWHFRSEFTALVHQNRIWVMGGAWGRFSMLENGQFNDVWWSSDGLSWHQATPAASWQPRFGHTAASFLNKMWILGGNQQREFVINTGRFSDVYCTGPFTIPPPPPTSADPLWNRYE